MDLDEIGALCAHPDCCVRTYLPYSCEFCDQKFCDEHRSLAAHACENAESVSVPSCPSCHQTLHEFVRLVAEKQRAEDEKRNNDKQLATKMYSIGHNSIFGWAQADDPDFVRRKFKITQQMADEALALHLTSGRCSGDSGQQQQRQPCAARKTSLKHRCALRRCKKKSYVPMRCAGCGEEFCAGHRHALDHKCGDTSVLRTAASKGKGKGKRRKDGSSVEGRGAGAGGGSSGSSGSTGSSGSSGSSSPEAGSGGCSEQVRRKSRGTGRAVSNLAGKSILVK
jgi:predicted nucleic acid binding AN1-type Zn finger protein